MRAAVAAALAWGLAGCAAHEVTPAVWSDCADCPPMVTVPAGETVLGSTPEETAREGLAQSFARREQPQQTARVPAFALGRAEVSRAQFAAFVAATGYAPPRGCYVFEGVRWRLDPERDWRDPGFAQGEDEPAVCLSRTDGEAYAAWLSARTGQRYRLPTEAEWERAARAGTVMARFWGDGFAPEGCGYANSGDAATERAYGWSKVSAGFTDIPPWRPTACDDGHARTAPPEAAGSNAFMLVHMLGNAQEWTAGPWRETPDAPPDPAHAALRGQGWTGSAAVIRSAFRLKGAVDERRFSWGVRVARDLQGQDGKVRTGAARTPP